MEAPLHMHHLIEQEIAVTQTIRMTSSVSNPVYVSKCPDFRGYNVHKHGIWGYN